MFRERHYSNASETFSSTPNCNGFVSGIVKELHKTLRSRCVTLAAVCFVHTCLLKIGV
jgi:hypothetical protein